MVSINLPLWTREMPCSALSGRMKVTLKTPWRSSRKEPKGWADQVEEPLDWTEEAKKEATRSWLMRRRRKLPRNTVK